MRVGTNYVIGNSQLKVQVYLLTHESLLSIRLKTFFVYNPYSYGKPFVEQERISFHVLNVTNIYQLRRSCRLKILKEEVI